MSIVNIRIRPCVFPIRKELGERSLETAVIYNHCFITLGAYGTVDARALVPEVILQCDSAERVFGRQAEHRILVLHYDDEDDESGVEISRHVHEIMRDSREQNKIHSLMRDLGSIVREIERYRKDFFDNIVCRCFMSHGEIGPGVIIGEVAYANSQPGNAWKVGDMFTYSFNSLRGHEE